MTVKLMKNHDLTLRFNTFTPFFISFCLTNFPQFLPSSPFPEIVTLLNNYAVVISFFSDLEWKSEITHAFYITIYSYPEVPAYAIAGKKQPHDLFNMVVRHADILLVEILADLSDNPVVRFGTFVVFYLTC